MRKFVVPLLLALVAGGVTLRAFAADNEVVLTQTAHVVEGYLPDRQTGTAYRTEIGAVDTGHLGNIAAATTISSVSVVGKVNLPISTRFTGASGSTVGLTVVHLFSGTAVDGTSVSNVVLGIDTFTATATAVEDANGDQVAETSVRDTMGASHVKVFCSTAPSSGLVSLVVGSF